MKAIARYSVQFGLTGCYMPDSHGGVIECTTRRELASFIRDQLEFYEFLKNAIRQVKLTRVWSFIKAHGSSTAHFSVQHGANTLSFTGLTEEEFQQAESEE